MAIEPSFLVCATCSNVKRVICVRKQQIEQLFKEKTYTHKNASFIPSFIIYETKEQIGIFASFSTPPSWFVWRIIRLSNPTKSHLKPLGFPSFLQIVQSNFTHYHRSVSSVYSIPLDLDTPNNTQQPSSLPQKPSNNWAHFRKCSSNCCTGRAAETTPGAAPVPVRRSVLRRSKMRRKPSWQPVRRL